MCKIHCKTISFLTQINTLLQLDCSSLFEMSNEDWHYQIFTVQVSYWTVSRTEFDVNEDKNKTEKIKMIVNFEQIITIMQAP